MVGMLFKRMWMDVAYLFFVATVLVAGMRCCEGMQLCAYPTQHQGKG